MNRILHTTLPASTRFNDVKFAGKRARIAERKWEEGKEATEVEVTGQRWSAQNCGVAAEPLGHPALTRLITPARLPHRTHVGRSLVTTAHMDMR